MWLNLTERFSAMTKATIFQMKTELQNIKKGSESVSVYLQKIKDARDHLAAAGVSFDDDDIIILALKGLPSDFNTFRCVVRGRENGISLKDFRSQLLAEEAIINQSFDSSTGLSFGSAMVAGIQSDKGKALALNQDQAKSDSDHSFKTNGGSSSASHSQWSTHGSGSYNTFNGGYHTYGKGNSFRGRGKGRMQYNFPPRFSNGNPGILGTPKPYQSYCPDHPSEIPTCQICNKKGHVAADCFQRHNTTASNSPVQCQICWKYGHSALQCYHRSNFAYQGRPPNSNLTAMHANYQPSAPTEQFWVADTGATSHMTSDLANLDLSTPYQGSDTITTASGAESLDTVASRASESLSLPSPEHIAVQAPRVVSPHPMPLSNVGTQHLIPVDPDFHPESLSVVLPIPLNVHPMQTRSKNGVFKPKVFLAKVTSEPKTFKSAALIPEW
ncbi:unnamed protein product [Malus baccata var. baccata]